MSAASFRKIRFFGPGRRLAASGAPKIGGGASLARRENRRFPAIRRRKGFEISWPAPLGPDAARLALWRLILGW